MKGPVVPAVEQSIRTYLSGLSILAISRASTLFNLAVIVADSVPVRVSLISKVVDVDELTVTVLVVPASAPLELKDIISPA